MKLLWGNVKKGWLRARDSSNIKIILTNLIKMEKQWVINKLSQQMCYSLLCCQ